jgi:hypothetical protein
MMRLCVAMDLKITCYTQVSPPTQPVTPHEINSHSLLKLSRNCAAIALSSHVRRNSHVNYHRNIQQSTLVVNHFNR